MITAKRVLDWVFNAVLVLITLFSGFMTFTAPGPSAKAIFALTGLAFGVAAFIFIRFSILTAKDTKK